MKPTTLITAILAILVAGIALAAVWLRPQTPEPLKIRLGINPWPGYEALYLAKQRGLFERHGLDVQLVEFTSVGDCLRGYQVGNIDALTTTLIEVVLAETGGSQGAPITVLVTDVSDGADLILAKDGIKMSDLRGKRVGVEPASLGLFILDRALAKQGLTRQDVQIAPMGQEEMRQALASNAVAAVVTYAPYSVAIEQDGAKLIFTSKEIPDEVLDIVSVAPKFLQDHPQVAPAFTAVWTEVMALLERDREASIAVMAQRQRISPAEFLASMEGLRPIPGSR
jgi:NitT/TauT family transport system substrate-binding protein